MCMCECEWVGKGEWERRLIKIWMWTGVGGGHAWGRSVCMCAWETECVVVIMLISLFLSKTLEEYFLLRSFFLQPGSLLPPMLPTFMLRQGWSEGQKSGNQVNYGWWLADMSEIKRARECRSNREREWDCCFFYHLVEYCWVTAASLAWPGRLFFQICCDAPNKICSHADLPLECHINLILLYYLLRGGTPPSCFTRIRAHLEILKPHLCFLFVSMPLIMQKGRDKAGQLFVLYLIKKPQESLSNAFVQQAASKLNSCSVHTSVALRTNRALFPADRCVQLGFMLVLAHNGTSADLWLWHWPLVFQGLGAETDVGKLPHVNKSMGPTC